jgi:hypothetical protein
MPVINQCIEPGCSTLCIGLFCVQHDVRPVVEFQRGRPWPPQPKPRTKVATVAAAAGPPEPALTSVRPAA